MTEAREVECPICRAEPGKPCWLPGGRKLVGVSHNARGSYARAIDADPHTWGSAARERAQERGEQ